jgi:hypothetical protein
MDSCPKAEPQEQRGLTLYILANRLQKQKANLNPYTVDINLLAISFSQCYVTFFMFQFFKFYLSAMPSLPPATLSEHKLVCFFSGPPPCYRTTPPALFFLMGSFE